MATLDLHHDIEPVHRFQKPVEPSLSELRQRLSDAGVSVAGGADHATRNDLIFALRVAGVSVNLSAPTGLTDDTVTDAAITVEWDAVAGAGGYQARLDGGSPVDVSGTSHEFTGLDGTTQYSIDVRTKDTAGYFSAWSAPILVTTV